jgi:hypothetical protein
MVNTKGCINWDGNNANTIIAIISKSHVWRICLPPAVFFHIYFFTMKHQKISDLLLKKPLSPDAERLQIIELGKLLLGCKNSQSLKLIFCFLKLKISLYSSNPLLLSSCFTTLQLLTNENKIIAKDALELITHLQTAIFTPIQNTNIELYEKLQLTALLCVESISYVFFHNSSNVLKKCTLTGQNSYLKINH